MLNIDGVIGVDLLLFGSGGVIIQEQFVIGVTGFDSLKFGAGGSMSLAPMIHGIVGVDLFLFGHGGIVRVQGIDLFGVEGFALMEFGGDGAITTQTHIRGFRGKPSTLQFGIGGVVTLQHPTFLEYKQPWTVLETDVYFRRGSVGRNSARHFAAEVIDLANNDPSMVAPWRMVRIPPAQGDRIITVQMGEGGRCDIIAMAVYGRSDWWWIIMLANDILNPFEEPVAGDRIRVPTQSRIQNEILGAVSSGTEVSRDREVF